MMCCAIALECRNLMEEGSWEVWKYQGADSLRQIFTGLRVDSDFILATWFMCAMLKLLLVERAVDTTGCWRSSNLKMFIHHFASLSYTSEVAGLVQKF